MGDLFLLSERQMARIAPHFPLSHGVPRVNDRRVAQGLAAHRNPLRPLRPHLLLGNLHRCRRHLLVVTQ